MMQCEIEGCGGAVYAKARCHKHYRAARRSGVCRLDGCDGRAVPGKLCKKHQERLRRYGSVDAVMRKGPAPGTRRTEEVGYSGAHKRLGPVGGMCGCGRPAKEWSYDHDDPEELLDPRVGRPYSLKADHYQALCVPCHRKRDQGAA